jgi:hypothetical protein
MRELLDDNIGATTPVYSAEIGEWKPLSKVPGLREAIEPKAEFDDEDHQQKEKA